MKSVMVPEYCNCDGGDVLRKGNGLMGGHLHLVLLLLRRILLVAGRI